MCHVCGKPGFTRREFVQSGGSAVAAAFGLLPGVPSSQPPGGPTSAAGASKLEMAVDAARWISACRIVTDHGVVWPADPNDPSTVSLDLYHGSSGVVLFLLELYRSTGEGNYAREAILGADHIVHAVDSGHDRHPGLYTGLAGMGVALTETYRAGGESAYRDAADRCFALLRRSVVQAGAGVTWDQATDIISGCAGIGLALVYAGRQLGLDWPLEMAVAAGRRLAELGVEDRGGLKWPMSPDYDRLMPNFSHGTAGVCYFLATVYGIAREREFLDAALAGGRYLQAISDTDDGGCLVFHHEPGGEGLYYLSWCHGPAGTARLFYRLAEVSGDESWMEWVHRCARALVRSGIPERRTPGLWNNVSQCCGDAGVGEFLLALVRRTGDPSYWTLTDRIVRSVTQRAASSAQGTCWVQAEHRARPDMLVAQTGFMQGASGVGSFLLHVDAFERGKDSSIALPDSPFA